MPKAAGTHLALSIGVQFVVAATLRGVEVGVPGVEVHHAPAVSVAVIAEHDENLALVEVVGDVEVRHRVGQVEHALRLGGLADLGGHGLGGQKKKYGGNSGLHLVRSSAERSRETWIW